MPEPRWIKLIEDALKTGAEQISGSDWEKIRADLIEGAADMLSLMYKPGSTGEVVKEGVLDLTDTTDVAQITEKVLNFISKVTTDPDVIKVSELMGGLITHPFVSLLEEYAEKENYSAVDFSRAFHGATSMLTLIRMGLATLETQVFGIKAGPISEAFGSIYWNLGLGFLGWQTLAPLLSAGLQPKLTRYYNRLYTPSVFDLETQVYRYHIGEIDAAELINTGRDLGWAADKVQTVVNVGYRTLTRSDMNTLYQAGEMSFKDIKDEMLKQGYNPRYLTTLAHEFIQEVKSDERLPSLATARKAYREGLYTDAQFAKLLQTMGYGADAIQLERALVNQALQQEQRELTISQIKQAYAVGEITDSEVRFYLQSEGYQQEQILILLNTWSAARKPKILKLNKGSITSALTKGIINAGEAGLRLRELGYPPKEAEIIVNTALASGGISGHAISISKLLQAFSIGAITQTDLNNRLRARGVSEGDILIYVAVALHQDAKPLTNADVQQGYLYGLLDNARAIAKLQTLDYELADAQFLVQTWEKQRETFRVKLTPGVAILYYRQGLLSSDELRRKLIELGFSGADAQLMVRSADLAYPRELTNSEIEDLYFTGIINESKAIALLGQTGLNPSNAQLVVKSWSAMLGDIRPQPTVSQYLSALRDGLLTETEFVERLKDAGYTEQAIAFYVRLADEQEVEVTKALTKADVLGLYDDELLSYTESLERLIDMGYSPDDSELLLARKKPEIKDSQAHKLFMGGYINPEFYVEILLGLGFTPDDIDNYLTGIGF